MNLSQQADETKTIDGSELLSAVEDAGLRGAIEEELTKRGVAIP